MIAAQMDEDRHLLYADHTPVHLFRLDVSPERQTHTSSCAFKISRWLIDVSLNADP